jgi:hypothetical protein
LNPSSPASVASPRPELQLRCRRTDKLGIDGKLDPRKASEADIRGQAVFFGKGQCATCHVPPYYADDTMHNLKLERFFKAQLINGRMTSGDGPIKTFSSSVSGMRRSACAAKRLLSRLAADSLRRETLTTTSVERSAPHSIQEKKDLVTFLKAL